MLQILCYWLTQVIGEVCYKINPNNKENFSDKETDLKDLNSRAELRGNFGTYKHEQYFIIIDRISSYLWVKKLKDLRRHTATEKVVD